MTAPNFWPGSGSMPSGLTPLGLYDDDDSFVEDAPRVASWVATRLGYPVMTVELTDSQIYACFEEAINEYSSQVNEFNMRENMLAIQGTPTGSNLTHTLVKSSGLPYIIEISEQYGTEAGVGGNVDWKKGYITTKPGQQEYDLQTLWAAVSESGNRIEIRRVFHERTPAVSRGGFGFGEAGIGPNDGQNYLLGEFGWAGYDGGLNAAGGATTGQYLMMPIFETVLRTQSIEFNDIIRRSQFSFEIVNNKLKIFPMPSSEYRIFFQYLVKKDRTASSVQSGVVSDFSNAPYQNMTYSRINDVGKNWIRKYTLALSKESLGRILGKYENLPTPDAQGVRLDGPQLRAEAQQEKDTLWQQLRETLEETGRAKQMEKMAQTEEKAQELLRKAPLLIYVG